MQWIVEGGRESALNEAAQEQLRLTARSLHQGLRMKRSPLRFLLFLLLVTPEAAYAQQARNAAYFEIGGSAGAASLNYERQLRGPWYGRAGLEFVTSESSEGASARTFVVPLTVSWVSRPRSNHHLEAGGGVTIGFGDRQDLFFENSDQTEKFSQVFLTGILGYRYQKPGSGFQFRSVFTPLTDFHDVGPWLGVSFGYAW